MAETTDAPEPVQDIESDLSHLTAIDGILGRRNLPMTLAMLARWSFFIDPVFSIPFEEVSPCVSARQAAKLEANLRGRVHQFILAYLSMIAVLHSNPHLRRDMTREEFLTSVNHFINYNPPIYAGGVDDSIDRLFVRLAFQQFTHQRPWWSRLSSASFIFGHDQAGDEFSMCNAVREVLGVSYDELVDTCICLYSTFHRSRGEPLTVFPQTRVPWLSRENGDAVLGILSQTQAEFREKYAKYRNPDARLRIYDFNPLFSQPMIRMGQEHFAPMPSLIPAWAGAGIAYRLLEHYGNGSFTDALGRAFEAYVGHILTKSGREFLPEQRIAGPKGEVKTADFIVIEEDKALILECKTRRFALRARYGEQSAIDREFERSLAKGLSQCFSTAHMIEDGRLDDPRLRGIRHFTHVLVTLDEYHLANALPVGSQSDVPARPGENYHVFQGDEFEVMLTSLAGRSLISFLQGKLEDPRSAAQSFRGYLAEQLGGKGNASIIDPGLEYIGHRINAMAEAESRSSQTS